ncbi:MAG: ATP-binding protein [bacterium]|nr:ATP-binding protein [bacterium]
MPAVSTSVEDSGIGIMEEDMKELYPSFYTTRGVKGTGLGLAISCGTVKGYGGDINLRSKDEKGVIASIYLPYKSGGS